jgi:sialate O-acetylesterase
LRERADGERKDRSQKKSSKIMRTKRIFFGLSALILAVMPATADIRLPSIISDHMVLLKAEKVPVWGWADAGETVSVTLNGQERKTVADAGGKWRVDLNLADSPQGPFEMVVQGKNTITIADVLVGEVWLGSGQSNMEQMMGIQKHAEEETLNADNPMLRQFITIKKVSMNPEADVDGFWLKVAPGQTYTLSALGYYFSNEIHGHTQGPVGIIKASWGGQRIQRFISPDAYDSSELFSGRREFSRTTVLSRAETFVNWLDQTDRGDRFDADWTPFISGPTSDAEGWVNVPDRGPVEHPDLPTYGAIWFRKEVVLTEPQSQVPQYLFLGMKNIDFFHVYFNGVQVEVSDMKDYTRVSGLTSRVYLTPELMREGANQLALRVFAPHRPYEFAWPPGLNGIPITGGWRAKPEYSLPELTGTAPAAPLSLLNVDCALFDGMIRPLIPYALRGVLWYQGESNTTTAGDYREQMRLLINGWRSKWGSPDMPFYFCQLANWRDKVADPALASQWAELREAQLKSLSVPGTGMAVLIDTGESKDIHPQSKDVAGERLAKIAQAKTYGEANAYSGPLYESMKVEGTKIRLSFKYLEGGLVAKEVPAVYDVHRTRGETAPLVRNSPESELEGLAICGADQKWVWADAKIDPSTSSGQAGDTVLVWSDKVPAPVAVRYGWADNPTCNLFNQAGLPASPFRTDDFKISTQR